MITAIPDTWLANAESIARIGEKISPQQACELAAGIGLKGIGWVSPNPLVGAVFVNRDHVLLGYGAHEQYRHNQNQQYRKYIPW